MTGYATWAKLTTGAWGVRVEGGAEAGDVVATKTRAEKVSAVRVGKALRTKGTVSYHEVIQPEPTAAEYLAAVEAAVAIAEKEAVATEAAVAASRATDAEIEIPVPDGLAYMPFQRAGIVWALSRPRTLIGDEPGLGKSIETLGLVNADVSIASVLCIVPASIRVNWLRESRKWLVRSFKFHVAEDSSPIPHAATFVIINFDKLIGARGDRVRESLSSRDWDLIVIDECHFLANPKTQRTVAVLGAPARPRKGIAAKVGLVDRAKRLLCLSGTPIQNRPMEFQTILGALDQAEFGNRFTFGRRYASGHKTRFGWDFSGASNLEELQQKIRSRGLMIRRLKTEVLTELPPKRRQVLVLPADDASGAVRAERAAYDDGSDDIESLEWEADAAHAAGDMQAYEAAIDRLRGAQMKLFATMAKLRRETAIAKVPKVIGYVRELLDTGEAKKIVVWGHHHAVIDALTNGLADYGVVKLDGRDSMSKRDSAVQRFQEHDAVRVFVGGIKAAGVGLTLTATSRAVFAELDYTPSAITQAEDRCHRIGQTGMVLIQHLVLDGSLDVDMARMLTEKQEIADRALNSSALDAVSNQAPSRETAGTADLAAAPTSKNIGRKTESLCQKKGEQSIGPIQGRPEQRRNGATTATASGAEKKAANGTDLIQENGSLAARRIAIDTTRSTGTGGHATQRKQEALTPDRMLAAECTSLKLRSNESAGIEFSNGTGDDASTAESNSTLEVGTSTMSSRSSMVVNTPTRTSSLAVLGAISGRARSQSHRPSKYPATTDEQKANAAAAMLAIDALCDGVRQRDGQGWSGVTRVAGHSLAEQAAAGRTYSDGQVYLATKLARTHKRQLPEALVEALGIGGK